MNSPVASRIISKTFKSDVCRFSCVAQSIFKVNRDNNVKKNNHNSFSLLSNQLNDKTLCHVPLRNQKFINRNSSNDASLIIKSSEKLSSFSPQISPAEEAAQITTSNLSKWIVHVSDWKIVELAQKTLLQVHETTGLPWWGSIALTAFVARTTVTFPLSMYQLYIGAKLQNLKSEMDDIVPILKREANLTVSHHGWPETLARKHYNHRVKKEWNALVVRDNVHPAKIYVLLLVQLPLWFSFSIATRNLCCMLPKPDFIAQVTYMEMMVGGFGWVTNLTNNDPYFILPFTLGIINLTILEVHQLFRTQPLTRFDRIKCNIVRAISVALIPIASFMPAATNVYWLTSSSFGLLQAFLMNSTKLRRLFRIPTTENELEHPYKFFYNNLKNKLSVSAK